MLTRYTAVIAVFNGERYISRAVQSALDQDTRGEIIVVNDGSSDSSGDLARAFGERVKVIDHRQNLGISAARNTGIDAAATPIVAFLDSDDRWEPRKMRIQLSLLESSREISGVFSDFRGFSPSGASAGWQGGLKTQMEQRGLLMRNVADQSYVVGGPVRDALIRHTSFIHPSTFVVRREDFLAAGGFDPTLKCGEDLDAWIRLSHRAEIGYVDEVLTNIEVRPDSLGHQTHTMSRDLAKLYSAVAARYPALPPDVRSSVQHRLRQLYADLGWMSSQCRQYDLAAQYYGQSLGHGWTPKIQLAYLAAIFRKLLGQI